MSDTNHQPSTRASMPGSEAELREILVGLKGKGPHEVLGSIAQSHLGWAIVQATVGCIVLLAILTVGPYFLGRYSQAQEPQAAATETEPDASDAASAQPTQASTASTASTASKTEEPPAASTDGSKDAGKPTATVVEKLKENETKKGTPTDPFGTNLDDLLDK